MKKKIDNLGRIVLPAEMKKELGLENGSEVNIEIEDHKIIISKPGAIDYKAIVDKAIEYIKKELGNAGGYVSGSDLDYEYIADLLEILKGGNNE